MIVERVLEAKQKKIKQYPVHSNRASEIGHPCTRYHVLNRTRWQEKALHDVRLQQVFDLGNVFEDVVLRDLADAGIKVIEQQRSFTWPEYKITGHVDGLVCLNGGAYPLEIKSCSPFVFKTINTVDDLKNGKYAYLRKYPAQLTLYMLMSNIEKGVFLFKDKVSGAVKEVWMSLDYTLGEELLKRCEEVNRHVDAGTVPDAIEYDEALCDECPYAHICTPDRIGREVEVIDDKELSVKLDRLATLKDAYKEYNEIDKEVKTIAKGREKLLVGNWFLTGKMMHRKGYMVPDTEYWQTKIMRAS